MCTSVVAVVDSPSLTCRGGKYSEEDAKAVMVQILTAVAFCHLQGVVHRDLKPEVKDVLLLLPFTKFNPSLCESCENLIVTLFGVFFFRIFFIP